MLSPELYCPADWTEADILQEYTDSIFKGQAES
jgi:hypothetical protein